MPNDGIRFDQRHSIGTAPLERSQASHVQGAPQGHGLLPERVERIRTQARHAIGQRPLQELRPLIARSEERFHETVTAWARLSPPGFLMPRRMGVIVPGTESIVQIDGRMFEAEVRALPRGMRRQAVQNMPRILQERVDRGYAVWNGVRTGALTGPARTEDIRDLMTFFMVKGMEKGDPFREGSFSIEDPGQRLKKFLDSCPEGYNRASSHIRDFQRLPGGQHRGIDLALPYGHHTLLYGAMSGEGFGLPKGLGVPSDRIFLKMEQHGCRLFQSSQRGDPPARGSRLSDVREFLGHAVGYFKTLLRTLSGGRLFADARDSRKERIPKDIAREYTAILRHLDRSGQQECAQILRHNKPLNSARGLHTLYFNLTFALNRSDLQLPPETKDRLMQLLDRLLTRYDNFDVRIGNEVILNQNEILGVTRRTDDTRKSAIIRAATSLMRQTLASLLDVNNPDRISAPHTSHFLETLTKISVMLYGSGEAQDIVEMLSEIAKKAISPLTNAQKEQVWALLTAPPMRTALAAMASVLTDPRQWLHLLNDLPDFVQEAANGAGARVAMAFSVLTAELKEEAVLNDVVCTPHDLDTAKRLLTEAGYDIWASISAKQMLGEREAQLRLARERVGLMPIAEIRNLVGDAVLAIGSEAQQLIDRPEDVPRETIGRQILEEMSVELNRTDRNTGLLGLNSEFLNDFFRTGVEVNGTRFGGSGTNIPHKDQIREIQAFIDAVGGIEKARHISQVAYQNAWAILMVALNQHNGLQRAWANFESFPGETVGQPNVIRIKREREDIRIDMETGLQKVAEDGREMGRNLALNFTIQGAGTPEPVLRLDNWDVIYSSRTAA